MLAREVEAAFADRAVEKLPRQRRAVVLRRRPGERDKFQFLALMQLGADTDAALVLVLAPYQRGALAELFDALLAHAAA